VMLIAIPSLSLRDFGRLQEVWALVDQGSHTLALRFAEKSTLMGDKVLGPYLDDYGSIGLVAALISIVLMKTANTAGWVSVILIALGLKDKKIGFKSDAALIFIFVSLIALINMAAILLRSYVLSSRYIIALGFILLIFSSFVLAALVNSSKANSTKANSSSRKKWLLAIVIVILCLNFVRNVIPKREGYGYEKEAVEWVKQNTPKGSSVFYVSPKARYYAGVPYAGGGYDYWVYVTKAINDGSIHQYDYLIIPLDKEDLDKQKQLEEALVHHVLTREFLGFRGKKKILIFSKK
jgi:hypothetical protein